MKPKRLIYVMVLKFLQVLFFMAVCRFWFDVQNLRAEPGQEGATTTSQTTEAGKVITTTQTVSEDGVRTIDVETRRESDGVVISRHAKVLRANEVVSFYSWDKAYGKGARYYFHNGKALLCEGDENGDGVYDLLIFFDSNQVPVEAFTRHKDGTVLPVSRQDFETLRKGYAITDAIAAPVIKALGGKATGLEKNNSTDKVEHRHDATGDKSTP